MKIVACYIRVSEVENDQTKQRREMNRWLKSSRFSSKAVRWYIDKPTNKDLHQPKLEKLKADILEGRVRTVVVWHLDRLALAPREGLRVLIDWCDKSLRIVSVSQQIDIKSGDCGLIGSVLRGVAEMDAETRRERTKLGLAVARARGREGGRPSVAPDDAKVIQAKKLQKDVSLSIDDICERLKISRSTYYRYLGM
jgi:DNA invertase Pin-like site-specific DNA recombinase